MPKEYSALRKQNFPESQELFGDNADALLESLYKAHATGQRRKKKGGRVAKASRVKVLLTQKTPMATSVAQGRKTATEEREDSPRPKGKSFPKRSHKHRRTRRSRTPTNFQHQ